ncbi:hypothetical protein CEXT_357651, partial [Caerostris extrusa]
MIKDGGGLKEQKKEVFCDKENGSVRA